MERAKGMLGQITIYVSQSAVRVSGLPQRKSKKESDRTERIAP